jgi:hypothetical protein
MELMEKLRRLISHWQEHNREHAESYRRWAQEASLAGYQEIAEVLDRLYRETIEIDALFEEAWKEVDRYVIQQKK